MKKLTLFVACLAALTGLKAQADSIPVQKQKNFIAAIKTMSGQLIKGPVSSVNDSQLVLKSFNGTQPVLTENIKSFTIKRKNSVLKGALIGFAVGAATGIIIGFASGDDPVLSYPDPSQDILGLGTLAVGIHNAFAMTAAQKAVMGGALLGGTGAIVGTIIGAVAHKTFVIHGKRQKFHDLQGELMMKLVKK